MKIPEPEIYFGKKIRVISTDGDSTVSELYGYSYDFDDDGNEFLAFDVEDENGWLFGFDEDEIERIEIIK